MPEYATNIVRMMRISLAIMTLAGYLALATTASFGPEITVVPFVLIACMRLFERLDAYSPGYRRLSQAASLVFTIVIVPYLFTNLISGLTAIILYIQTYLFLHRKGVKEYRYLFLMAFFLLVDAVAQSPDSGFGLVMPVFVLSAVWAFASVQIYAENEANEKGNIADLLPSEMRRGFLPPEVAQWVTGGRQDRMSVAPVLGGVSLGCVVVTLLFFLFTPRMDAGLLGRNTLPPATLQAGLDDGVNLSAGGNIAADEAPVFMVRFPTEQAEGPPLAESDLYWRVTSYNRLIGADWSRIEGDFQFFNWRGRAGRIERDPPNGGREVTQDIFLLDTHGLTGLPALPGAYKYVPTTTARLGLDETEISTIHVVESANQGVSYRVTSRIPQWTRNELLDELANYAMDFDSRILFRRYTENRLSGRTQALAARLTEGLDSPYAKAEAIQNHLRDPRNYAYTTSLESLSTTDPIDDFLFVRRRGHCELYASAMCMLVRSVGIPARVVSGFRDGEWSPSDNAYIVRRRHAHLWVEIYLNRGVGWVMFDPSGEAEEDNSAVARLKRAWGRYLLMAKYTYYRDIVGYNSGIQLNNLVQFSIGLFSFNPEMMQRSLPQVRFLARGLPAAIIITCIVIAIGWGFVLLYRSASMRRRSGPALVHTADQARATRLYNSLRKRLAALGSDVPGLGVRELALAAESNPAVEAVAVSRILRAYQESRFGGRPMDRKRYDDLMRAVRQVKREKPAR